MACLFLGAWQRVAVASAWNEPQGQGIAILSGTLDSGRRSFDRRGRQIRTDPYSKKEGSLYIEYGVTDWLQVIAKPAFVSTTYGTLPAFHYDGLGTSEFGAQAQLAVVGPARFAVQGTVQLPATTREENLALIGNTSRNTDARALAGIGFALGPWPSFLDAEAGYRIRGSHAPDEIHVDLTLGTRPLPQLLLLAQSFTTVPEGPGTFFFPRSTYSNVEVSCVYDVDPRWSVQLGGFTTIYGRDALHERGLDLAVWRRF